MTGRTDLRDPLEGVADPTLSTNAYTVENWSSNHPLLDISKQMSAWDSASGDIDWMIANGYVDAATSWITATTLPGDFWKAIVPDRSDSFFDGKQYRMRWSGAGKMTAPAGARIDRTSPNQIVFTLGNVSGGLLQVRAASGPISDLTIVDTDHADRYDAGERIAPEYAELVSDLRMIRFMDWNHTNGSDQTNWASRPVVGQNSYSAGGNGDYPVNKAGVPVELMVELCNKVKADMYFCFPHAADDVYVTRAATYIRDNLDTELTCFYERSNEVWNYGFTVQQEHFLSLGQALWPDAVGVEDPQVIRLSALGYRTYRDALLIDAVYAGIVARRGITISVQLDFTGQGIDTLDATTWRDYAENASSTSGAYVAPHSRITHLAITSYFGFGLLNPARMAEIEAAYPATSDALIDRYLRATGRRGDELLSLDALGTHWAAYDAVAAARNIKMMLYEGGPHMIFFTGAQTQTARDACNQWLDSSLGAGFCDDLYDLWQTFPQAQGPFMQFQDVGQRSVYGTWTIWENQADTPAGYMAQLLLRNATDGTWWGATTDHRHTPI